MSALCNLALARDGLAAEVEIKPTDRVASLAPYVNDDTFAVAHIDLRKIDFDALALIVTHWLKASNGDEAALAPMIANTQSILHAARGAGVETISIALALGDIHQRGGPFAILTVGANGDPREVERQVQKLLAALPPGIEIKRNGYLLQIGAKLTLERYATVAPANRPDLIEPLRNAPSNCNALALVVSPGSDFRRVVREIWPELPGPLAPLRGELADRWQRLELAANLPPQGSAKLTLRATDAAAGHTFVDLWKNLPAAIELVRGNRGQLDQKMKQKVESLLAAFSPRVEGNDVVVELPADAERLANLTNLALDVMHMGMESAWHRERMQKFKQLALAMHNFADAHKRLPSSAIRDDDGRPLLSWRVAVLPYVEQGELFNQFHLDEPWDSPHNKTLIEKMPAVFADPDARLKKLAREGRTTYQVPVGEATMFFNDEGATFRDITDGTSNTIMIIEVAPDEAAIWTQPDDWEFDAENTRRGLERQDRDTFVTAFADGSARTLPVKLKRETLRALVTRAGKEVVRTPYETDDE